MRSTLLLLVFLTISPLFILAQSRPQGQGSDGQRPAIGILKGKIIDEATSQPIEYGTIAILSLRDSSLAGGTITDPSGNFRIEQVKAGRYMVRVQYMGYETLVLNDVFFKPSAPEVNLGTVKMKPASAALQGVEVTAEREMMVSNLDKKIINVDKSIAAVGGSAVDVMQNIPSVTVDVEGNVSLRGSSNVTILVDGKPTGLAEISSGDLLQQIPASSIESIEVVTNPSVRYDAEGTTGIINIVLKKRSLQGLNGLVSFTAGTGDRYNTSINLNYRKNRFNVFAGYDNRLGKFKSTGNTERFTTNDEISTQLFQDQKMNNERNMHNLNTGFDYLLNEKNTLSFNYQLRRMSFSNVGDNRSTTYSQNEELIRDFNRFSTSDRNIHSNNYTLSYKRNFQTKGKELTADFMITDNFMSGDQDIRQTEYTAGFDPDSPVLQQSSSENTNRMYMMQANYALPFANGSRIETGFKSTITNLTMRNELLDFNYSENDWIQNEDAINNFDYFEQLHAVYGIYSTSFKKFKIQAGLRAEQLISESEIIQANDKFDLSYLSLFPSVHTVYDISKTQQTSVSYSRRIRRPRNRQLNPYVDYSDSLNISYGNPKLQPEFINSFELGWSNFWGKNSVNSTVFYRYTTGVIDRIVFLLDEGVTATTYENLTSSKAYGIELIGNKEFTTWFKTNANVSIYRSIIDGSEVTGLEKAEGNMWTAKLNLTFVPFKNASLMVAGNYRSPEVEAQEREEEVYFADVAFRYDFWQNKASVSLRVSDVFDSRRFDSRTWGEGFTIQSSRRMETRVAYLGFSYKINNYKRQREKDRSQESGDMEMDEF
ncbi:MAG: TonB-dependent receptor [Lentimicrobium sp.]|jgi:outer membrane receptor protein involved in Fe transport|nr:TonB-dependent receptor [Lentimicrobium sp.]